MGNPRGGSDLNESSQGRSLPRETKLNKNGITRCVTKGHAGRRHHILQLLVNINLKSLSCRGKIISMAKNGQNY